jgi:hypothetical protein
VWTASSGEFRGRQTNFPNQPNTRPVQPPLDPWHPASAIGAGSEREYGPTAKFEICEVESPPSSRQRCYLDEWLRNEPLIEPGHVFKLDEINAAFDLLQGQHAIGKIVLGALSARPSYGGAIATRFNERSVRYGNSRRCFRRR